MTKVEPELRHSCIDVSRHGSPHWKCSGCGLDKEEIEDLDAYCPGVAKQFIKKAKHNQKVVNLLDSLLGSRGVKRYA